MTPQDAINTVWPCGNPSISEDRIEVCVPKVHNQLNRHGFAASNHGSYMHLAMLIVADKIGGKVSHNKSTDTVFLDRPEQE